MVEKRRLAGPHPYPPAPRERANNLLDQPCCVSSPQRVFALARGAIALAEAGFARRSQSAGGSGPFEGPEYSDLAEAGFARRSQSAGGSGPFEGPEYSDGQGEGFSPRRRATACLISGAWGCTAKPSPNSM
jgi:hypothetical protein